MTDTTTIRDAHKPWQIRIWFLVTWAFAYPMQWVWRVVHRRMGADAVRFQERLGLPTSDNQKPVIWFHAASLGEVGQIAPLVRHFSQLDRTALVTTGTQAGADWVAQELPAAIHQFAPMETGHAVRQFLGAWDIRAAIFIEGDLGPRLTLAAQSCGIPMALLNARHSRTRERFPAVFSALLNGFSLITCRSETVARSLRALGLAEERLKVLPDLRIGTVRPPCPEELTAEINSLIAGRPVWLAASTHSADEDAVLAAHSYLVDRDPDTLLIIAPRHPKRGGPIANAARAQGLQTTQRSFRERLTPETQVYVADTLGELGAFYSQAPVTFLGGSFGDEGGHNPYEPASFGSAILTGRGIRNFAEAFDELRQAGAAEILSDAEALGPRLAALMHEDATQNMGEAGQRYMQASETSIPRTIALLESALNI